MKKSNLLKLLILIGFLYFTACQKETIETTPTSEDEISEEILNKLENFYLTTGNVKKVKETYPDGTTANLYEVEGDITFTEEQIMDLDLGGDITSRQFRSTNLVNQGMRIRVLGWTGSGLALNRNAQTALRRAVANFNNLGITFTLSFGTDHNNADIVIYDNSTAVPGRSGGRAGFPHKGRPHKWIQIFGLNTNERINEHVMTHEIGHAIGLRHTDWVTRPGCNPPGSEGAAPNGAIQIPGTPANGNDLLSVMVACGGPLRGELSRFDIIALEFLYPR